VTRAPRIAALDGLRGLAVVAVVIYHAWPSALPGGWIGVSVFFVLSGYLITGILLSAPNRPLYDFWTRRARRLLPAAITTVAITVGAVAMTDAHSLAAAAREGLAATTYVHNWWSAANTGGYWEIFDSTPRPLAHMWSLSIEEQVYLVWPVLIVLLGVRRALVVGLLVVVAGMAVWWGSADAYFATPVRFAEVLAGAALAVALQRKPSTDVPAFAVALAGAVLVWWTFVLEESDQWVSTGALLVVAVASAVMIAGVVRPGRLGLVLATPPLVWLGQRSYAIYLFHWPLLVLLGAPPWVAVAATLALAELSHHVIEWPIRSARRLRRPLRTLGAVSAVLAVALIATAAAAPAPPSDAEIAASTVAALVAPTTVPVPTTVPLTTRGVAVTTTTRAPLPVHIASEPTAIIVGDSTGYTVQPAVEGWIGSVGGTVRPGAFVSCGPLFNERVGANWAGIAWTGEIFGPFDGGCRPAIDESVDLVLVIDHGVVLMDHLDVIRDKVTSIEQPEVLDLVRDEYERMIAAATVAEATVMIFTPPKTGYPRGEGDTQPANVRLDLYRSMIDALAATNANVVVVDTGPVVESNPERYVRSDGLHLDSDTGAVNFIVDLVAPLILFANG